ncbi:hypothetical protein BGZ67_002335 [Mortierella alpina]|nr:hypothetical protein BGZ67_002335 [Mortierella alpina]
MAVITDCPNATNAAQWFYKPYLQPSSIATTATSSLMPSHTTACTVASAAGDSTCSTPAHEPAATLYTTLQSSLAAGTAIGAGRRSWRDIHSIQATATAAPAGASLPHRTAGPYSSHPPSLHAPHSFHHDPPSSAQIKEEPIYHNPYRAPSHTNSRAFVPPYIAGYEFSGGSQAGNMGLMLGRRIADRAPVTAKLHQSRVLLQHEFRIYKRLEIANARYVPDYPASPQPCSDVESDPTSENAGPSHSQSSRKRPLYQKGSDESERYFNRIVEDFIDLDQEDMSILILERLGSNLLSHTHHQFLGLEDDGLHCPETQPKLSLGSPFPDVYTFLVFALKAACVLEALLHINLAHLAICPTALHWMPTGPKAGRAVPPGAPAQQQTEQAGENMEEESATPLPPQDPAALYSLLENMDINNTTIRLFDFTHSRVLSHERARAPNNIAEWQIPGYLEYHLQYLAPEQTGRAETWMDHRTDIYGLGATLFSLLTMQFPNSGHDSVQILQGVLSRELPPLNKFRPDMPPVIDGILRKMTQKQPSQRYQNAFGFKQDILKCLNALHTTGKIESFELGQHDVSYQFVLPNTIFGRHFEQQMISAAIVQAANAYQQALHSEIIDTDDAEPMESSRTTAQNSDHYVFADDIVALQNQASAKISLSSRTLLRTPRPFDGGKAVHRGAEASDPVIRVIFVSGPSGVGKTVLIRGMAAVARNSGLFAGGVFEAEGSAPYSAILSCIQSVLQQLLAQHTDALASLVVAIRTAFEPSSGIGIICDLIPELRYFFNGSEMPESKDVPLTHSVARFHSLILKLIRVISTHFFMTWLIDDLHFADENSIELLATLVNVNKRLPIVLIITHRDTIDCLMKVKHILGGGNIVGGQYPTGFGVLGAIHHDPLVDDFSAKGAGAATASVAHTPMIRTTALRATGRPLVVRGGGGVRFIRLQNPAVETVQEFLAAVLHRDKTDVGSLAKVLSNKSWLTIRQLVLELYRNQTICFSPTARDWEWETSPEKLAEVVRQLTGEEYAFLESRFRALDCDTKKTLICASICGPVFTIQDLQLLVSAAYSWTGVRCSQDACRSSEHPLDVKTASDQNQGCNAMAGLQSAIREGILVYTSVPDRLRFHHGVMRRVAINLLESQEETEKLHFEMAKILFKTPGQEFRTASHVLQCLNLIKRTLDEGSEDEDFSDNEGSASADSGSPARDYRSSNFDMGDASKPMHFDVRALRKVLSLAGEKSQKSGAQDMALSYWNAALSLLPENCWEQGTYPCSTKVDDKAVKCLDQEEDVIMADAGCTGSDAETPLKDENVALRFKKRPLYHEALKLHLQCIEAERWRENFDQAMKICEIVLANVDDPIDRARVYQHQIEMSVWAYSQPEQATAITIQCLEELGMPKDMVYSPTDDELRRIFDSTHKMLLQHMPELEADPPKLCDDRRIAMMMEVLSVACASLYYCNIPFMASGIAQSMRLTCEHGLTKDAGRALVSFALTYSTWYGCLDNAYELGRLACKVSKGNHHVKFLFYLTVQQWGEHVVHSIPALEETLTAVDLTCDRLFHTAGMIHVSVMKVLIGRVHLNELMSTTIELLTKHVEFGPKSHGVEVMQGILQLIKCLKGRTLSSNPETIFDDIDLSESSSKKAQGSQSKGRTDAAGDAQGAKDGGSKTKKTLTMVHNNSTYQMLKVTAAFAFGHYAYVDEVTDSWHDDPKSIMNFEGSWITHSVFTVISLSLANLLRTETDSAIRTRHLQRLFNIRDRMRLRAHKYPTNHAAMYYLLEAEIADQGLLPPSSIGEDESAQKTQQPPMKEVLLLYEKAIMFSTEGNFPLHKCFSYELAAKCHLRLGLITSARCLMSSAARGYQDWGARGKYQWIYKTFPELFGSSTENENVAPCRGLFYRPNEIPDLHHPNLGPTGMVGQSSAVGSALATTTASSMVAPATTSPWLAASPGTIYSPASFGSDAMSAAAAAIAVSCMTTSFQPGGPSGNTNHVSTSAPNPPSAMSSTSSSSAMSAPLYSLQNTFLNSPQSPELDNVDLDVLDFSSVIEAMQVIASEIDLDLLLVKSLGVLNQSVGAKQCCVIIYKDDELVLAASQGNSGRCESVNPPLAVEKCQALFHGIINYVVNTSAPCLLTHPKDDPRFSADEYLRQRPELKTVLCAPILHKAGLVGVLYMEEFPERAFANKRMLVMNLLVQQLGISITNALLYQSVLQSESKLNGLLENMPCGIALWDAPGENCQYINSSWEDMTGFTIEEIMASSWRVLVDPEELLNHGIAWKNRINAGQPCQWECRYGLKDGTFRWAIIRMLPIMAASDQSKILQWLTMTIDIDDQRKAVQLKSNFLANMSHELRTPFSGILGMLSLLKDSSGLSHEQFEFVDMAKASCEMLIRIVDDLLNFSKLEADKVTLEYIPLCFEEILGASRKGLELIILVDDTLPTMLIGDPDRMKQILMNLIGNAIKFSTSGNVVIRYWHEAHRRQQSDQTKRPTKSVMDLIANKCRNTDYYRRTGIEQLRSKMELEEKNDSSHLGNEILLYCSVTDQGIGMTPQEQKMLFVSFQQTDNGTTRKYGGTGLGLSICAQIIAHMNGKITVDSEKGHGSTFTFSASLRSMTEGDQEQNPIETARIQDCETVMSARWDSLRSKKVLILSPNKLLRQQIMNTVPGAEYLEFDDVASAVQAGAIGVLGAADGCCVRSEEKTFSEGLKSQKEPVEGVLKPAAACDKDSSSTTEKTTKGCGDSSSSGPLVSLKAQLDKTVSPFDFILVDHVLDSAELDCIYPSPVVAFVLLLAPTTETLRWILPPAERRIFEEVDEIDSGQVDVGGRGRIQQSNELEFAEKAIGQVRSASYMSKIAGPPPPSTADSKDVGQRLPSQLFKRKMALGSQHAVLPGGRSKRGMKTTVMNSQVVRMIKPVRRLKLLQIMYNALTHYEHRQQQRQQQQQQQQQQEQDGDCENDARAELSDLGDGDDDNDNDNDDEDEDEDEFEAMDAIKISRTRQVSTESSTSMSMSISSSSSADSRSASPATELSSQEAKLKRRRSNKNPLERMPDELAMDSKRGEMGEKVGRGCKAAKTTESPSTSATVSLSSSPSSSSVPAWSPKRKSGFGAKSHLSADYPKRARNNDALTLLLTADERKRCRGINVLVAEDDFVSQVILEKQLSKLGMNVKITSNGQEAVEHWLAAERGHYAIAIFDHHMPIMDGLAATRKIRALEDERAEDERVSEMGQCTNRIPIVGLSADIQLSTKEKCIKAGMNEYMTKPLLTRGLALLIQRYCSQHHAEITSNSTFVPTQTVADYWVWAESTSKPLVSGLRTGKWMLFYDKSILDAKWAAVKELVEHDQLGGLAKCSTAMENPNAMSSKTGVIIIYTSDYDNQEEVYDVAVKLQLALEYNKPMYYKTDDQTRAGMYAKNGSKKNHLYKYPLD